MPLMTMNFNALLNYGLHGFLGSRIYHGPWTRWHIKNWQCIVGIMCEMWIDMTDDSNLLTKSETQIKQTALLNLVNRICELKGAVHELRYAVLAIFYPPSCPDHNLSHYLISPYHNYITQQVTNPLYEVKFFAWANEMQFNYFLCLQFCHNGFPHGLPCSSDIKIFIYLSISVFVKSNMCLYYYAHWELWSADCNIIYFKFLFLCTYICLTNIGE